MNNKQKDFTTIGIFLLTLLTSQNVFSLNGGISGYSGNPATTSGSTCSLCHSGGTTPITNLSGPAMVQPGTINTYTLTISGGQQRSGGMDVSTDGGTLINTLANTRFQAGEIIHIQRKPVVGDGSVSWSFDWQAPTTTGMYTLYGAGLSTNGDNSTTGDGVATTTYSVMVSAAASQSPRAVIQAPLTAQVNSTVSFDGSASSDPDGIINQYEWDFGDGNTASGAQATNTFTTAGIYTVRLTITDSDNLTHTTFQDISVGGKMLPIANPGGPYTGTQGQPVNFNASLSTHIDPITNYIWDFGDGSAVVATTIPTVSHIYNQPGAYMVTLAVQDANSITGVDVTTVVIRPTTSPPDGPTLYANNCAICHGPLASSSKLNRSASQIQGAIDANIGGMDGLRRLTPTEVQAIADALVSGAPPPTDGPTLYANNCAACHGPLASSSKLNRSAGQIQGAIDANIGSMGYLSVLTPTEVQAIADALVSGAPPPTDGPTLYANNCAACHGPLATSSKLNRSAGQIQGAIDANIGSMGYLSSLTPTEVQAIADALVSATPPPTDGPTLYTNNCAGCHGPLATSSKLNRSAGQIQGAIDANAGGMGYLSVLTPTEVQSIADALVSGTPPTTGEELYDAYCLACHGPRGRGGLYEDVTGEDANDIARAIVEEPLMNAILLNSTQIQAIADYLSGN